LVFKPVNTEVALGLEEFDKLNFNVFYNGNEHIIINNKNNLEINQIQIYNSIGQHLLQLKENMLQSVNNSIPFNYPKGMYLVVVESGQGTHTYKIVN
jgi:hypothetical protein